MPPTTPEAPWPLPELTRARRAIVVVDVVESVRLMQEDEAGFIDRWRRYVHEVRSEVLPKHGGRLVKSLGDGMLLAFEDTARAAAAALRMQGLLGSARAQGIDDRKVPLRLRMGLHVGDVTLDEIDVYGHGVNLAARLATLALPGEIVASADARDGLTDYVDAIVEDMGECRLKHLEQPVRAFRIGPAGDVSGVSMPHLDRAEVWQPTLAVMPFSAYDVGRDDGVIGEVLADEIITSLSRAPHLRVISRLSTRALKNRDLEVAEIGRHLGSPYVLSGAYRRAGDQLFLRVELADAASGHVLWSDALEDRASAVFSGQSTAVQDLSVEVARAVVCEEVARSGRRSMPTQESYTLLMAAIHLMHRNARNDFERGREMLDHLIDRNPDEPLPRAWMGKWYGIRAAQGWTTNPLDDARQALAHVQRAIDCDPDSALAWAVKGLIHSYINKDMTRAREAYGAALAANPSESLAWLYSATLNAWHDEGADAITAAVNAQRLSPLDPLKYYYDSLSATAFLVAGEHRMAIDLAQRSLRQNRTHTSTHRTLAIALLLAGEDDAARTAVHELMQLDPSFTVSKFRHRYPGRDSAHADAFCRALAAAGVPA